MAFHFSIKCGKLFLEEDNMTVGEFIGQIIAGALNQPCSHPIAFMIVGLAIGLLWGYIEYRKKHQ